MRYLLPLIFTFLLLGCDQDTSDTSSADELQIENKPPWSRVVRAGLFRVIRSGGVVENISTTTGKEIARPVMELAKVTDRIPMVKDAYMSVQYKIGGLADNIHWVELRRVLKHPPMTLPDGSTTTGSDYIFKGKVNTGLSSAYAGYGLNEDYEMVEGDWIFQIWLKDKKLIEHTFTTYMPDEKDLAEITQLLKPREKFSGMKPFVRKDPVGKTPDTGETRANAATGSSNEP